MRDVQILKPGLVGLGRFLKKQGFKKCPGTSEESIRMFTSE